MAIKGRIATTQDDRAAIQHAGDVIIQDWRPSVIAADMPVQAMYVELPRERLEHALGSSRRYTALTMRSDQPSTILMTTFFDQLVRVQDQLSPDAAARMAAIGIDLIVASVAERMAREPPKSLQGTLTVQRAKAFVEAHLGDPALDPPMLAAAVGVSLRHLQHLFGEHGRHVSDWIWKRRLEVAAQRLADPGSAHLSIGELAYGCGFASQPHFTRRFKARYDLTPSEYRWQVLSSGPEQS